MDAQILLEGSAVDQIEIDIPNTSILEAELILDVIKKDKDNLKIKGFTKISLKYWSDNLKCWVSKYIGQWMEE